ncbi:hypothetical protein [Bosea sp. MMO-172]|uniref:hypothetical protein n=1 Tax=Bosea sp. MMO-172 TaxID=3127885 RepID=UPI00301902BA
MIRPFHTLPDIMELGLLVARIQNESGADRDIDEEVMSLFFKWEERFIGVRDEDGHQIPSTVWVSPLTNDWVSSGPHRFTGSVDWIVQAMREFLPETSWSLQAPSEQPATALVRNGAAFKARTALTPQRALLTAFLCLADQIQREAA